MSKKQGICNSIRVLRSLSQPTSTNVCRGKTNEMDDATQKKRITEEKPTRCSYRYCRNGSYRQIKLSSAYLIAIATGSTYPEMLLHISPLLNPPLVSTLLPTLAF